VPFSLFDTSRSVGAGEVGLARKCEGQRNMDQRLVIPSSCLASSSRFALT
jgi:hypothetical protein